MNWTVYILRCADGSLYTGITNNLAKRLLAHERGSGARYTKGRAPFNVLYEERCRNRSEATRRECEIKKLNRQDKLRLAQ